MFYVKIKEIKMFSDDYPKVLVSTELKFWNMMCIEQEAMIKDSCKVKVSRSRLTFNGRIPESSRKVHTSFPPL